MRSFAASSPVDLNAPLTSFSKCHAGIVAQLQAAAGLPEMIDAAAKARGIADQLVKLFDRGVMQHHADEEKELFPAVQRSAHAGDEAQRVAGMVDRLVREHRTIERLWKRVEPPLRSTARGHPQAVDGALMNELVHLYLGHAKFEEEQFLPLAQEILGRNGDHMAALGIALHLRHAEVPVGYV